MLPRPSSLHTATRSLLQTLGLALTLWGSVAASLAHASPHFVATPVNNNRVTLVTPGLVASDSVWLRCPEGMTWSAATLRCDGVATALTYDEALAIVDRFNSIIPAGEPLWQIPTANYLSSLLLSPLPSPLPVPAAPLLETVAFPNTPIDNTFWTSTPTGYLPLSGLSRLTVNFADGTALNARGGSGSTDRAYLRLVQPLAAALHKVTINSLGAGSVSPVTGMHTTSANLVFTATPDAGNHLTDVRKISGDCVVDELSSLLTKKLFVTVGSSDCTVRVEFTLDRDSFLITATATPTLGGRVDCPARAARYDDTDCLATPATGYHLLRWEGCDGVVDTTCQFKRVLADRVVQAFFAPSPTPASTTGIPTLRTTSLIALSALLVLLSAAWMRRRG